MKKTKKLLILDRDGVINVNSDNYIRTVDEWIPIESSLKAIAMLYKQGYTIVVATNQSGIGRQYFSLETLNGMHQKMYDRLSAYGGKIDRVFFCPHKPDDNCTCRKPRPGLVYKIAEAYQLTSEDLRGIYFVGDSLCDIQAAIAAGCQPILVKTGNGIKTKQTLSEQERSCVSTYNNLWDFSQTLLKKNVTA